VPRGSSRDVSGNCGKTVIGAGQGASALRRAGAWRARRPDRPRSPAAGGRRAVAQPGCWSDPYL